MTDRDLARMLSAQLQVQAPEARVVVIAAPRSNVSVTGIVAELAAAAPAETARAIDLNQSKPPGVWSLAEARAALREGQGRTYAGGGGFLDTPNTLVAAAVADAVIVAARRGRTTRSDLQRVREELAGAGARVVGAVLLD